MIKQIFSQRIIFCVISNLDFRSNQSKNLCLTHLTDKVLKEFNKGLLNKMIIIDLQKAFDTINNVVLLQKPKPIRFSEHSIQWLRSYLCDLILLVEIENKLSEFRRVLVAFVRVPSWDFCF